MCSLIPLGCRYPERNERVLPQPGVPAVQGAGEPTRPVLTPPPLFHLFPVPIDATQGLKMLYVFVDIKIDTSHFLETLRFNFAPGASLALVSTIQFVSAVQVSCGSEQPP